jgi:DNA-binding PadR family transcriptional regulator
VAPPGGRAGRAGNRYIEFDSSIVVPRKDSPPAGRLLGLYALSVMAREGPVHGYELAQRIAVRTQGSWRPGAGAIYPALTTLARRGLARSRIEGRRRVYVATRAGRTTLRELRARVSGGTGSLPDLSVLWAEIAGDGDTTGHLLRHLRRHLDQAVAYVEQRPSEPAIHRFAETLEHELAVSTRRLRSLRGSALRARGGGAAP